METERLKAPSSFSSGKSGLRLLLDPAPRLSPGGSVLGQELPRAAARMRPPGCELMMLAYGEPDGAADASGIERVWTAKEQPGWVGRWRHLNGILPAAIRRNRIDVVFALAGYLTARLRRSCGTICTVNNMLPFTPAMTTEYGLAHRVKLHLQRRLLVRSLRLADAVVLHSMHALGKVSHYAGDITDKTIVALTGVPSDARICRSDPSHHPNGGRPYCIYLSVIRRYKNHLSLLEAYRRLTRAGIDLPELILAGHPIDGDYLAELHQFIAEHGLSDKVRYAGTLPRAALKGWLHHAEINVFASGCETNSLVLAEILGAEGVLACSRVPPMPEIIGSAGEFFCPDDPESIAETLAKLWRNEDRRRELRREAAKRSQELSWDECGRAIWDAARAAHQAFERRRLAN